MIWFGSMTSIVNLKRVSTGSIALTSSVCVLIFCMFKMDVILIMEKCSLTAIFPLQTITQNNEGRRIAP